MLLHDGGSGSGSRNEGGRWAGAGNERGRWARAGQEAGADSRSGDEGSSAESTSSGSVSESVVAESAVSETSRAASVDQLAALRESVADERVGGTASDEDGPGSDHTGLLLETSAGESVSDEPVLDDRSRSSNIEG